MHDGDRQCPEPFVSEAEVQQAGRIVLELAYGLPAWMREPSAEDLVPEPPHLHVVR
jgi:hypothetical protein